MKLRIFIFVLMSLFMFNLRALPVRDLYMATVPVATQSDQLRAEAVRVALQQVLIKVNGNSNVLNVPGIKDNIVQAAANDLRAYAYQSMLLDDGSSGLGLTVAFDSTAINQLLTQANQTLWGINRPVVLIWLAIQQNQNNYLVAQNKTDSIVKALVQDADALGLPIILPVMDLNDIQAVSFPDVWQLNFAAINQASLRYRSDAVLIGRVSKQGQNWTAQWTLFNQGKQTTWTSQGNALNPVLKFGISLSAQTLAANYVVPNHPSNEQNQTTLTVTHIDNIADYAKVMNYLRQLTPVKQVSVAEVDEHQVVFNIDLAGNTNDLVQAISLEHTLVPSNNTATNETGLIYQWLS